MSVQPPSTVQSQAEPQRIVGPRAEGSHPTELRVSPQQHSYLDELEASGIRPSTDLLALSIGSYVCQARAAKQPEAAVRDYVTPLVRGDMRSHQVNAVEPSSSEVDAVTADYIRIATERLC